MYNDLQKRLPNLPVFGWLSNKDLKDVEVAGCSTYPEITDLYYRNKYWQIFVFLDQYLEVTFHLYGSYFDNRTLLPNGPMIRVISMVHSRFVDLIFNFVLLCVCVISCYMIIDTDFTEKSLTLSPSVTSGIMTLKLQSPLLWQILIR